MDWVRGHACGSGRAKTEKERVSLFPDKSEINSSVVACDRGYELEILIHIYFGACVSALSLLFLFSFFSGQADFQFQGLNVSW